MQSYLSTLDQIIKNSVNINKIDLKLVVYSETSGSSGGEEQKDTESRTIAVAQPVQHQQTVPEPISENPLETAERQY